MSYFTYDGLRVKDRLDTLDAGQVITQSKGDLIYDNGGKSTRLEVGTVGQVLYADPNVQGVKWSDLDTDMINGFDTSVSNNTSVVDNTQHRTTTIGNPHNVTKTNVGLGNVENIKVNLNADSDPTESNDGSVGYTRGSRWINTTTEQEWVCLNASSGNAVWIKTTEATTASNVGLDNGVGIFSQMSGYEIQLKKINPNSNRLSILDDTNNNQVVLDVEESEINVNNLSGLPIGDLVGTAQTQTLTNKTISDSDLNNNTLVVSNKSLQSGIDAVKIASGNVTNDKFNYLASLSTSAVGVGDTQELSNKTLMVDSTYFSNDNSTRQFQFLLASTASNAPSQSININIPNVDHDIDLVAATVEQTLSNKTLVQPILSDEYNNQISFTIPDFSNTTDSCSLTVPDVENMTLVGTSTTQTLTNKTMGDNLNMSDNRITNVSDPVNDTDAANKQYVDGVASGLDVKESVIAASTSDFMINDGLAGQGPTYADSGGSSGKGQFTANLKHSVNGKVYIDGIGCDTGARILLKDQSDGKQNGIWTVAISGNDLTLDRANDFTNNITSGAFTFVEQGNTNADSGWVLSTDDNSITIGTTALAFSQFSGAGQISAGSGMTKSGNILHVVGSDTILAKANSLEVKSSDTASQILLSTGNASEAASYGQLPLGNVNSVTGTLSLSNGGTGASSFSNGDRVIAVNNNGTELVSTDFEPNEVVLLGGLQTLSQKTLMVDSTYFSNYNSTRQFQFLLASTANNAPSQSININIPNVDHDIDLVAATVEQTLTHKTIDAGFNTISNISDGNIKYNGWAGINANKIANGVVSNEEFNRLHDLKSSAVGVSDEQVLSDKTLDAPKIDTGIYDTNGNELLNLSYVLGAVNEFTVENALIGTGPILSATGDDTDIDLSINAKNNGNLILDGLRWPNADGAANQVMVTNGNGNISFADANILTINEITTTSNTLQIISTKSTTSNRVYLLDATIVARRTENNGNGDGDGAGFILRGLFINNSGTLTKIAEDKVSVVDNNANWNIECEVDTSANIIINVSGLSNTEINWKCSYRCTDVG